MRWAALLLMASLAFAARPYTVVAPNTAAFQRNRHTHVEVTGKVTLVKREADGDTHIRISDDTGFIVAECIPQLPCKAPKVGQRIRVRGISRFDKQHGWWECHPVESLEVLP